MAPTNAIAGPEVHDRGIMQLAPELTIDGPQQDGYSTCGCGCWSLCRQLTKSASQIERATFQRLGGAVLDSFVRNLVQFLDGFGERGYPVDISARRDRLHRIRLGGHIFVTNYRDNH